MFTASFVISRIHLNMCGLVTHRRLSKWPRMKFLSYIVVIYCCVVMVESSHLCTTYNMDGLFVCPVILPNSKCVYLFAN
jgi:hypothetical protein